MTYMLIAFAILWILGGRVTAMFMIEDGIPGDIEKKCGPYLTDHQILFLVTALCMAFWPFVALVDMFSQDE